MMSAGLEIRRAELSDLEAITAIYNEAVLTTTATFDTEPKAAAERVAWFESHDDRHPILVAVSSGQLVGWASLSRWSERPAYDDTAEHPSTSIRTVAAAASVAPSKRRSSRRHPGSASTL